jgi:hypothetical protein
MKHIRVMLEIGPKGKKVAAVASDWPGLERGAKTGEAVIERLLAYVPRYAPVAKLAGMEAAFANLDGVEVVEEYPGTPSTDFWGISFGFSSIDRQAMPREELERELRLLRGCWALFDEVRRKVSPKLQQGPRGGGRDRDRIVRHVVANELDWGKKLGLPAPEEVVLTGEALKAHREAYCDAIRDYHSQGKLAGKMAKWPLRYLIRHTAYHTLDHSWEMEDRDLTGKEG